MHPTPHREHPGVRDTASSASDGLLAALGLTVVGIIIFVSCLMYGFGAAAAVAH
jgi:hypothetical protein